MLGLAQQHTNQKPPGLLGLARQPGAFAHRWEKGALEVSTNCSLHTSMWVGEHVCGIDATAGVIHFEFPILRHRPEHFIGKIFRHQAQRSHFSQFQFWLSLKIPKFCIMLQMYVFYVAL